MLWLWQVRVPSLLLFGPILQRFVALALDCNLIFCIHTKFPHFGAALGCSNLSLFQLGYRPSPSILWSKKSNSARDIRPHKRVKVARRETEKKSNRIKFSSASTWPNATWHSYSCCCYCCCCCVFGHVQCAIVF